MRRAGYVSVNFPTGTFNLSEMHSAEIISGQGVHDVGVLTFGFPRSTSVIPAETTPVWVEHGSTPQGTSIMYGYVNHAEGAGDQTSSNFSIYLIGTSLPLNGINPQTWDAVSPSFIARQVAERYRLRAVISRSSEVLPYWAQGNESDFHMMNRLAQRAGCKFWVTGSTLYFVDPTKIIANASVQSTQTFTMSSGSAMTNTLQQVSAVSGSLAPSNTATQVSDVYGISTNQLLLPDGTYTAQGTLVKASSAVTTRDAGMLQSSYTKYVDYMTQSQFEAQTIADSQTRLGNWLTAQAYVTPSLPVRVGDVVNLAGDKVPGPYQGLWMVSGVTNKYILNKVSSPRRITMLTLIRNQQDIHQTAASRALRGTVVDVPADNVNGVWESRRLETVYV